MSDDDDKRKIRELLGVGPFGAEMKKATAGLFAVGSIIGFMFLGRIIGARNLILLAIVGLIVGLIVGFIRRTKKDK